MIIKSLIPKSFFTVASGIVIYVGQIIDEKTAVPLFTGIGAMMVVGGLIWRMGRQYQVIVDELKSLKGEISELREQKTKGYDDSQVKEELSALREFAMENKAGIAALRIIITRLATERADDMDHLRSQLRTGTIIESYPTEKRILMVDDDEHEVELFRRKMREQFTVDSAASLTEANRKLRLNNYECVLLDLNLPDVHNLRATVAEFKADNPEQICVIVFTGNESESIRDECFQQGADDVWIKGKDDRDTKIVGRRILDAIWRKKRR